MQFRQPELLRIQGVAEQDLHASHSRILIQKVVTRQAFYSHRRASSLFVLPLHYARIASRQAAGHCIEFGRFLTSRRIETVLCSLIHYPSPFYAVQQRTTSSHEEANAR
jgi:hypothetical protein